MAIRVVRDKEQPAFRDLILLRFWGNFGGGGVLENSTLLQCLKHQESYTYRPEAIDRISLNLWSWEMPTQGQVLSVGLKVGVGSFTKAWNVGKTSPVAFVRIP